MATSPAKPLTCEQVKKRFRAKGITAAEWARQHGFNPKTVHSVLNGYTRGHFGTSHDVAVALGLKLPSDTQALT